MTINLRRIAALAAFLTICCASASLTMAQQASESAPKSLAAIKYDGDMASLLGHMAEAFNVSIGLEVDPRKPKSRVKLELRDATLHDVMNAVVQSEPRYQWREIDGFIAVSPVSGSSPLLDTVISNFQVSDVDQTEAINQLMSLPEVEAAMRTMNLNLRDSNRASTGKKGGKLSLSLQGVSMREALYRIFKESGSRFWVSHRNGNKESGEFFSISDQAR